MPRELLILRHGKSDWSVGAPDFERPLKDRGKRAAQRIGVWMARQDCEPDLWISSPATRAATTAEKACKAMGSGVAGMILDSRVYEANVGRLLEVLADCPERVDRVALVGHNPGLEDLLAFLLPAHELPVHGKLLPTATLARLNMPADWALLESGSATLLSRIKPRRLPKKFPYPDAHGRERRDRPAYYYRQSSVIPYRLASRGVEILVVSSSKQKHWVVPKGILEPGLSAEESAAIEAREEAGVEGNVRSHALGSYRYEKWGATCTVEVYALHVTKVLPEDEWQERHRGRRWVKPSDAQVLLRQQELGPLVAKLEADLTSG